MSWNKSSYVGLAGAATYDSTTILLRDDVIRGEPPVVESELVARAMRGDRDAYRTLVTKYQQRIFAVAYSILRSREDAEDVTQEAFTKAFFSLPNFKQESSFYSWIYRIVYNLAIDSRRARSRQSAGNMELREGERSELASYNEATTDRETPADQLLQKEKIRAIARALRGMTEEHRAVIMLREIDGMDYRQIAKLTGVTKGTVMSRLFYARKRLQAALAEFAPSASIVGESKKAHYYGERNGSGDITQRVPTAVGVNKSLRS